jgi:hypothetical protein
MLQVLNETYFIDFDAIEKYIDMKDLTEPEFSGSSEQKINVIKFELVKLMLDVIMTENEVNDEKLGLKNLDASIPFKLAFNSLLNKNLINHY